jgi:hypothetical protein
MAATGKPPYIEKAENCGKFQVRVVDGGPMADSGRPAREIVLR